MSLFSFIKNSSDSGNFKKYFPIFEEFGDFIEGKIVKAKLFQSFGFMFWLSQKNELAIKFLESSLKLINETDDLLSIPNRYTNIGYIYETKGDYKTAEKYYQQGLTYATLNNYQIALHMAFAALGRLKMVVGEYNKAIEYFIKTLNLIDNNPENNNRLAVINNLACCYSSLEEYKKSLEYFNLMPLDLLRKNDPEFYYSTLVNIAVNEMYSGNLDKAEEKFLKSAEYAQQNNVIPILQNCSINLGLFYSKTNMLSKAILSYQKAIKMAEKNNNKKQLLNCYHFIADVYKKDLQFVQAISYYKKSQELCIQLKYTRQLIHTLSMLSECYFSTNQLQKAYKTLKKYVETKDKYEEEEKKKENQKTKDLTYEAGRSRQYKFSEGLSQISKEMSNKIGEQIIGNSTIMDKVIQEAFLTSRSSEASILLLGESGTGKDLFAKLIHYASARYKGPFVAVNSSVFSAGLVQSALFGHRKGAFTGASYDHIGYFEEANNGTIFLDEISEMPSDIQANLLRILENKVIKRLGDSKSYKANFRLVSASNKDLYSLIEENKFRFDLFNRINTIEINIPPLGNLRILWKD